MLIHILLRALPCILMAQALVGQTGEAKHALEAVILLKQTTNNSAEVSSAFEKLILAHPEDSDSRVAYGYHLMESHSYDEAETQWRTALKVAPENSSAALALGEYLLHHKGQIRSAADLFERAVKNAPDNSVCHFTFGQVLAVFRHDLHDSRLTTSEAVLLKGLEHFRIASELDPLNADVAQAYAETFYLLEKPDWNTALDGWKKVTSLLLTKDFGYLHLARISIKLGKKEQALDYLNMIQSSSALAKKLRAQAEAL